MKNFYTTLIQGTIDESSVSFDSLAKYKEYGDVVISTYNKDILDINFSEEFLQGTKLVTTDLPEIPNHPCGWLKKSTFYYALTTMYNGVCQVRTPFVIKTRTDERWGTFDPFIEEFEKNYDSLVCGNIFCRKVTDVPYHFGDHIFIVKTVYLKNALKKLIHYIDNSKSMTGSAEQILCMSIMDAMGKPANTENFLQIINIVDINRVKDFHAVWRHGEKDYKNSFVNPYNVSNNDHLQD